MDVADDVPDDEMDVDAQSQPEDYSLKAAEEHRIKCGKHLEIVDGIQKGLSTSGGSPHSHLKQLRKKRMNKSLSGAAKAKAKAKAKPEDKDPNEEIELHMAKEVSLPFTEFRVMSPLLYSLLKSEGLCYFRAEPSHWQSIEQNVSEQRLFQFGVYGEMSLASLLSLAFKVVNIVGKTLRAYTPKTYVSSFQILFDAAQEAMKTINKGNQLVRDMIGTDAVISMIKTIGEILINLQEYYDIEDNTSNKLLYLDCHDLIVNILVTKPTLDGEQAAQLCLLIESQLKFLCYTSADKSAAFSVYYTIPVWSEYTIDRSANSSKTQFILESKMVYRFLRLSLIHKDTMYIHTHTEGFKRAAAILEITPEQYLAIILKLKTHIIIPKNAESKSWSSSDTESQSFNMRMDNDVNGKSVYSWLCDDTMDFWLNNSVLIKNRHVFFVSRMMFNYHCLAKNLQESKVRDPNCKSASIFDHDYDGLLHRFYIGAPILFHGVLNKFANQYGIDMTRFIGSINFEKELLDTLKEKEIENDYFFKNFIKYIKSDPFIKANLSAETKAKMLAPIVHKSSEQTQDPPSKMTRKRSETPVTLDHREFEKYVLFSEECAEIFDDVGHTLLNTPAQRFEEQWRWYSCYERCIMIQSSFVKEGEACMYVSRDINLLERMQDPVQGTVEKNHNFLSVIQTPNTPGGVGGSVDLGLSTGGTNLSVFSVLLNTVVTCVDSAHQKKGYFTSEVFSGFGQSLRYGGRECAYVHPFLNKHEDLLFEFDFTFDFTKRLLILIHKKPSCITAYTVTPTIVMFTEYSVHDLTLYGVISREINKISEKFQTLGEQLRDEYDKFYLLMKAIENDEKGKKGKKRITAAELWTKMEEPLKLLIRNMDMYCNEPSYKDEPIVANSVYSIFKYLELVLLQGEDQFNTVRLIMTGRDFPDMDSHRHGEGVTCLSVASSKTAPHKKSKEPLGGATKGPQRDASSQRPLDTKSKEPLGGAIKGPPRGPAKGGGWDDWFGNTNKKVLGYSFADVGNDLVLKPIYSEEEYKKLKHRQYINILLNIRQQQIENRIKQEQQTILNKQKPMISTIRKYLGLKPLRPVISYPQSHQPDLSKQKTMLSAVGNTIKRINPFKTPVYIRREGGKFTKKIKKTKQTRKYKPLSNKRTSYKLYR